MGASDDGGPDDVDLVNVAHVVDGHPADAIALVSRNQQITYGELRDQIDRLRGGLAGLGIGTATGSRCCAATGTRSSSPTWRRSASVPPSPR